MVLFDTDYHVLLTELFLNQDLRGRARSFQHLQVTLLVIKICHGGGCVSLFPLSFTTNLLI